LLSAGSPVDRTSSFHPSFIQPSPVVHKFLQ
jgi:hypothetical protein